jgi:Fe-S cluster biosynthesis and repair protein YggX
MYVNINNLKTRKRTKQRRNRFLSKKKKNHVSGQQYPGEQRKMKY